jgi:hypothetical protein
MPLPDGRLLVADVAALVGIGESDWRARVSRGHAPGPDEYVKHEGAPRPVWNPEAISEYIRARRSRLATADHPHTDPGDGRTECDLCGKFVWPATHSCKRVPVTPAAIERYNKRRA